jgi:hypothetical protein
VSRIVNVRGHPGAIGAHAWTHIVRVLLPHAGHTELAEAENAGVKTGTRDRGRGPGRYHGLGPSRGTAIIMGDGQGHARGLDPGNGDAHGQVRSHCPVLVPIRGLARGHALDRGRGRAIGEIDTESTLADLAPGVGPRVAVAAGNAKEGEREVARRMYVFFISSVMSALEVLSGGLSQREKRERRKNGMASAAALGGQWGKYGIISESEYVECFGLDEYDVPNLPPQASSTRNQNSARGLLRSAR